MGKIVTALLVLACIFGMNVAAQAQQTDSCKVCAEQHRACMKNYAGPTCKTEYQMCMKSCRSK
jgi:hypothetical protein